MRMPVILIIWITSLSAMGQPSISFTDVDTASYGAYVRGDWNKLIDIGNEALDNNIDYYYLRMRIGYAYFMRTRYRMAIPHYMKALEFNAKDPVALEYLYYCYEYSGRLADAQKLVVQFPGTLKIYLEQDKAAPITSLGFNFSYAGGASDALIDDIIQSAPNTVDGVQKVQYHYTYYSLSLSHRIGNSVSADHSIGLLNRDEFSWTVVNAYPYLSESQTLLQFNYTLGVNITPVSGFTLRPTFAYIRYRIPVFYDYGAGQGKNREVYEYLKYSDIATGLQISKQLGIFRASLAGAYSNLNAYKQLTGAAAFSVYPLGNLNLYYSFSAYYLSQTAESSTSFSFIQKHTLGFKVMKYLWLEAYSTIGEYTNFYDPFSEIVYNSLELHKYITGANLIIPFYKTGISIFTSYRFNQSESIFIPYAEPLNYMNSKEFNYQSIAGGILWKL